MSRSAKNNILESLKSETSRKSVSSKDLIKSLKEKQFESDEEDEYNHSLKNLKISERQSSDNSDDEVKRYSPVKKSEKVLRRENVSRDDSDDEDTLTRRKVRDDSDDEDFSRKKNARNDSDDEQVSKKRTKKPDTIKKDTSNQFPLSKSSISRMAKNLEIQSISSDITDQLPLFLSSLVENMIKEVSGETDVLTLEYTEPIVSKYLGQVKDVEDNEINVNNFAKYLKTICNEVNLELKKESVFYIHNAIEYYTLNLLRKSNILARHARRNRINMKDVELAAEF